MKRKELPCGVTMRARSGMLAVNPAVNFTYGVFRISKTFEMTGLTGKIGVLAHATVAGFPVSQ